MTTGSFAASEQLQTILLIDDSLTVRLFTAAALSHAGYRVIAAASAAEGLAALNSDMPNLVLLDVELPDAKTGEIVADIQVRDPHGNTMILLYSGRLADELANLARVYCVHGYFQKTHNPELLCHRVQDAWNRFQFSRRQNSAKHIMVQDSL